MAKDEKEALRNIINEYPDDIEAQIRLVEQSFNLPRGHEPNCNLVLIWTFSY